MYLQKQSTNNTFRTKSFACKTLARPRYCAAINSISAVCASSRSVFYVIGNCIAISYYIKKETGLHYVAMPPVYLTGGHHKYASLFLFYSNLFSFVTRMLACNSVSILCIFHKSNKVAKQVAFLYFNACIEDFSL